MMRTIDFYLLVWSPQDIMLYFFMAEIRRPAGIDFNFVSSISGKAAVISAWLPLLAN